LTPKLHALERERVSEEVSDKSWKERTSRKALQALLDNVISFERDGWEKSGLTSRLEGKKGGEEGKNSESGKKGLQTGHLRDPKKNHV